jgi:serine/threonine-protein kinase
LYVRPLDQFEASPIPSTAGFFLNSCFFSPDGRSVGFVSVDSVLRKVRLSDGLVETVARDVDFSAGGGWGADGRITFGRAGALWQVDAEPGGVPRQVTTLDAQKGEIFHGSPTVIPGGQVILFASVTSSGRGAAHIEALSVATGRRRVLVESGTSPLFASSGHLIFVRDGALLAAPFDVEGLDPLGPPVRVLENVAVNMAGQPLVAVSDAGALVYPAQGNNLNRLVWVSRQGLEQPITEAARLYEHPRLSPDGQRIVVTETSDLWVLDTARPPFTRLTSGESVAWSVWTPNGKTVVFQSRSGLRRIDADGGGTSHAIPGTSSADYPTSILRDGDTLALTRIRPDTSADLHVLSLRGESQPRALLNTAAYEGGAQFSPDGRWMAYVSSETGQMEVYVRPFPGLDRKWQVSTEGGTHVRWSQYGRELVYRNGNKMMAVGVSTTPELTLSTPLMLFDQRYEFGPAATLANYDVSPDGQRFVMVRNQSGPDVLNVVLNWFEELKAKVPVKR